MTVTTMHDSEFEPGGSYMMSHNRGDVSLEICKSCDEGYWLHKRTGKKYSQKRYKTISATLRVYADTLEA